MPLDWAHITPENLAAIDLDGMLTKATERDCHEYSMVVSAELRDGDLPEAQRCCLEFAQAVLSMMLHPSNPGEPYGPMFVFNDRRSLIPSDFPRAELRALGEWTRSLNDAELRARFCDVIWVGARDYQCACRAVAAYTESAESLESPEHWSASYKRLERAVRLAVSLGRGGSDQQNHALSKTLEMLDRHRGADPLFLTLSLVRLLLEFRHGDARVHAGYAETGALNAKAKNDFRRASEYHLIAAAAYKQAGAESEEGQSLRDAAEALASEAEKASSDGRGAMAMASILSDAVEAMRQAPGGKARAEELHARLLEVQPAVLEYMKPISTSTDCTEIVKEVLAAVEGKSLRDSVVVLCSLANPPTLEALKEQVRQQAEVSILGNLVSTDIVNGRGRVVAVVPSLQGAPDEMTDPAVLWRMNQAAQLSRSISVQVMINPARMHICATHAPDRNDVLELIRFSPWIPEGHHESVARALVAGFQGDMLVAAHMVPPQFEAVIRYAVERAGGTTSTLEPGGVQKESTLGTLLETPEAKQAFGEAGVFELQDLLTDALGANIRNEIAHGLMPDGRMFNHDMLYTWWLLLRVCTLSSKYFERASRANEGASTQTDSSGNAAESES